MILKGTAVGNRIQAVRLANHLLKANDNEVCEVVEIDGHARPDDLRAALADFYDMVGLTNGRTGLFMVSINPEVGERMRDADYERAIERLEETFRLQDLPKAVVRHYKEGREHYHIVWQTTNTETRKVQAEIYRYAVKCKNLSRELEREFGHRQISNEKSGNSYDEKERARAREGAKALKPDARKKLIQELFSKARDGAGFAATAAENGYVLAKGKVGYCLVDKRSGQVYNLEKELGKKVSQEQLTEFFASHGDRLPEASKLSRAVQSEVKREAKKSKAYDGEKREPKYRVKEGKAQELPKPANDNAKAAYREKAEAFAETRDEALKQGIPNKEQQAQQFADTREEITPDPKEVFKQKLRDAMENMREDKDDDRSR
ncbi:relaxase/mobilization nuclease domain-containing protein [Nostoc sp. NIES-2111]